MTTLRNFPATVMSVFFVATSGWGIANADSGARKGPTAEAAAQVRPVRKGFTLQLSMGAANHYTARSSGSAGYWGLGGLNLGIGGFVNPNIAILFLVQGSNFGAFNSSEFSSGVGGVAGPAVQFWSGDRFSFTVGIGLGLRSTAERQDGFRISQQAGLGLMVQSTVSLIALEHHALGLYAGVSGSLLNDGTRTLIPQFGLVWQYH